jgi:hypothetical protein
MKKFSSRTLVALLVCAMAAASAFAAKVKKELVSFAEPVTVDGTVLKPGEYQVTFNEETGELAFLKDGKLKAKTNTRSQDRSNKAKETAVRTRSNGGATELIGVTFGGSTKDVLVGASGGAVTGN